MNECLKCGACCRNLLVECHWHDVQREPRLLEHPDPNRSGLALADLEDGEKCIIIWGCPFLGPDNLCTVYPTRPNNCVGFEPGGEQCQEARAMDAEAGPVDRQKLLSEAKELRAAALEKDHA